MIGFFKILIKSLNKIIGVHMSTKTDLCHILDQIFFTATSASEVGFKHKELDKYK